ncbi:alpha/beta hydrolase [Sphingomonas sp. So64.6b]|uniref:alpha/beta fold hydrolase n=1 Tax=Sphingomonas sp. So64.6b TaxID=2997354 RepID=UPI0016039BF3|nr:alpha/beta fold hydrolase [Sphingomonas sp. So64.6b]QNA84018.1 alpha/beta hydrolase [Sphingomonas sp. So64.6b]
MANSPIEPEYFESFDGARIAWRETGEGRVVVLLHGFFSDAQTNWIRYGHAAAIAGRGFRVIMPDLRAHGSSAKPHDAASYPRDVLARDGFALIEHLGLSDYDLGGYSLGARTVARMMAQGATPRRFVLSGMGLQGLTDTAGRGGHFRNILTNLGSFERGTPEWLAEAFLKTSKGDPIALLNILDTFVDTPVEALRIMAQPALVLAGEEDHDNGSAEELTDTLPNATYRAVPGGHMSAVVKPELGLAIADFLAA